MEEATAEAMEDGAATVVSTEAGATAGAGGARDGAGVGVIEAGGVRDGAGGAIHIGGLSPIIRSILMIRFTIRITELTPTTNPTRIRIMKADRLRMKNLRRLLRAQAPRVRLLRARWRGKASRLLIGIFARTRRAISLISEIARGVG